jgi:HB1, ASXL, restriction endonuclease HTH domain
MSAELTWRKAIDKVLMASGEPLHCVEITERIIASGLRKNLGATPSATVGAQIAASIKHDGDQSPYVRVARGTFTLRNTSDKLVTRSALANAESDSLVDTEPQYEVITSFGMFWRKDAVEWVSTPKIWGMQIGANPVDFHKQLGIYLLYDGREVIYVGRATERPLGRRLYEHTFDRLTTRWDRFSWFGLLPVSEAGRIGELRNSYLTSKIIPAMEAVLIEALEPRQNRKRGDDLGAVEFIQRIDPEIEKRKAKIVIDAALSKL